MKKLAKLALFFSLSFVIVFLAAAGIRYLSLQVEWARNLPQKPEAFFTILIDAAYWALSLAMYSSILFSLSYAARRRYFTPVTIICVIILSLIFNVGFSFALHHWRAALEGNFHTAEASSARTSGTHLGGKGLLLSNSLNKNETAVVLLNGMAEPLGPRVIAVPDEPLSFQSSAAAASITMPLIPFGGDIPWFVNNLFIDIRLNTEQLQKRFNEGLLPYLFYAGALIFLLSSLGFVIRLSVWPLANLFLGILTFRGILAIETFFNSPEIQNLFESFFKNLLPAAMAVPLIFLGFSLLVHSYSLLIFISRRRVSDGD